MGTERQVRIGRINEMRILAIIRERPQTSAEIASTIGLKKSMVNLYLRRLNRVVPRRVYIIDHAPVIRGAPGSIWAEGDKPNKEYTPQERRVGKITQEERNQSVINALSSGPMTAKELSEKLHVVTRTIHVYVKRLRECEPKRVYICRYSHVRERDPDSTTGGEWAPVYAVGWQADAPKPKKETSAERHARLMKTPGYKKKRREQRKMQSLRDQSLKAAKKLGKQTWLSALGF